MSPTPTIDKSAIRPGRDYQAFLDQGRFMLLRPRGGGAPFFYPRVAAPLTGDRNLEWVEACGRGTVYSVTVVSQKPPTPNYNVVLVDLEEGPRVMSRVVGIAPEAVRIGMAVVARIERDADNSSVLVFEPASKEQAA
jgi:uncharacterized OB-fold protein